MSNDQNDIMGSGRDHEAEKKRLLDELYVPTEEASLNTAFEKDSAEGLAQLDKDRVPILIEQLNSSLRQQLKKKKKKTAGLPDQSFVYITVITVLVLVIIAYIVVRKVHSV